MYFETTERRRVESEKILCGWIRWGININTGELIKLQLWTS